MTRNGSKSLYICEKSQLFRPPLLYIEHFSESWILGNKLFPVYMQCHYREEDYNERVNLFVCGRLLFNGELPRALSLGDCDSHDISALRPDAAWKMRPRRLWLHRLLHGRHPDTGPPVLGTQRVQTPHPGCRDGWDKTVSQWSHSLLVSHLPVCARYARMPLLISWYIRSTTNHWIWITFVTLSWRKLVYGNEFIDWTDNACVHVSVI